MRFLIACALVASAGIVGGPLSSHATVAAPDVEPTWIELPPEASTEQHFLMGVGPTTDPEWAELGFAAGQRFHWRMTTGEFRELPDGGVVVEPGSNVGWEVIWPHTVRRHDLDSGTSEDTTIPFTFLDWGISGVPVMSENGRYWLIGVSSAVYGGGRTVLYDADTDTILTPDGDPDYGIGTLRDSSGVAVSDDGTTVWYIERSTVGAPWRHVRWDRDTDTHTVLGDWPQPDPDQEWTLELVDDQLVRTRSSDGSTSVVPTGGRRLFQSAVLEDGAVILALEQGTPMWDEAVQLFRWDGTSSDLELLSVGHDGEPADMGIDRPYNSSRSFVTTPDGSSIAFTSFATNLAPTLDTEEPDERRIFLVETVIEPQPRPLPVPDAAAAPLEPGETYCFPAVGAEPGDMAIVNVTPVGATGAGHATVHSSDAPAGPTSNVNFRTGTVDPNVAVAPVGIDGELCVTNSEHATVHLVVDQLLVGDPGALDVPTPDGAARLVDTRTDGSTLPIPPGGTRCATAVGAPGDIAIVNITPVRATGSGHGTLHSSDDPPGRTSNVNFRTGSTDPNVGAAALGADGAVCFSNSEHSSVHVILDQLAVADPDSVRYPSDDGAIRLHDTREADDGLPISPSERRCFGGVGPVAIVNLTPVRADARGNGALVADGESAGGTSNVNYGPGTVDPNLGIAAVSGDGVCFVASEHASVHVVLDQLLVVDDGVFSTPTPGGAHRLTDTRVGRFS